MPVELYARVTKLACASAHPTKTHTASASAVMPGALRPVAIQAQAVKAKHVAQRAGEPCSEPQAAMMAPRKTKGAARAPFSAGKSGVLVTNTRWERNAAGHCTAADSCRKGVARGGA